MKQEFRAWLPDIKQYLFSSTCVAYKFVMHKSGNWVEYKDGTKIETGPWEQNTGYILPVHTQLYVGDYVSMNYQDKNPIIREVKFHCGKLVLERLQGDRRTVLFEDLAKCRVDGGHYVVVGNVNQGVNRE